MLPLSVRRRIEFIVLLNVSLTTVIVTPGINSDPINLPKLFVLVSCGFALLGNFLPYLKSYYLSHFKSVFIFAGLFVSMLIIVMIASKTDKWTQFFGIYGRNTGFLAYFSLAVLLIFSAIVGKTGFARILVRILIITGGINLVYGLIQWSGNDPVNWNNPYNPIVGTLGNPNFISAHLGIASLAAFAIALDKSNQIAERLLLFAFIAGSMFIIFKSNSSQGLLIFASVATLHLYVRFLRNRKRWIRVTYVFLVASGSILSLMGILQRGPLSSILYQESVTYRGDYWRAGLKMTLENPFLGVGLDSYGDWYRFYRTETATLRRGPDVTSNSAHNVFLDISSNGGFPLLIIYLAILGVIFRSALRILKRSKEFDAISTSLVSSWMAYLLQSTISINQLGLAIWGWVLGGAIIGYDLHQRQPEINPALTKKSIRREQVPAAGVLMGSIGLIAGLLISIWPVEKDASFINAIKFSDGSALERAVDKFPRNSYHYTYLSQILLSNKFEDRALEMSRRAINVNPRDFNAWRSLISNPLLSVSDRANAISKMKELDPFNKTLDKQ